MANSQGFRPDWASPPGATIADILEEQAVSIGEFAQRLGQTTEEVHNLLQGRTAITIALARRLQETLGASVEFWMARDFQYRADASRVHGTEQEWLRDLPVGDMVRFGWISPPPRPSEEASACLRFFDVPNVGAWRDAYLNSPALAAFHTSPSFDSRPAAVAAWLRQGTIAGNAIDCEPWDSEGFRGSLTLIRDLTRKRDPAHFVTDLQVQCARRGVAVAVVRTPTGCRASGAATFLSSHKALILLSFRYLSDDHFWFAFFHEAGHLLLHGDQGLFVDGEPTPSTLEEEEANEFANNVLIPPEFKEEMMDLPLDARAVIRFARRVGVSPGIVVGQLQHFERIGYKQLNSLKRRFRWSE